MTFNESNILNDVDSMNNLNIINVTKKNYFRMFNGNFFLCSTFLLFRKYIVI